MESPYMIKLKEIQEVTRKMNGGEQQIYDRIEKLDQQNREEHREILKSIEEWHKICANRPLQCNQNFLKSGTFWKLFTVIIASILGAYGFAYAYGSHIMEYIIKFHTGG